MVTHGKRRCVCVPVRPVTAKKRTKQNKKEQKHKNKVHFFFPNYVSNSDLEIVENLAWLRLTCTGQEEGLREAPPSLRDYWKLRVVGGGATFFSDAILSLGPPNNFPPALARKCKLWVIPAQEDMEVRGGAF